MSDRVKQNRITVNFRLTSKEEQKLYNWIKDSAVILYKAYLEQVEGK